MLRGRYASEVWTQISQKMPKNSRNGSSKGLLQRKKTGLDLNVVNVSCGMMLVVALQ